MLFKKTGSAASSRGRLLTVLHTTQPASFPTMNSSEPSLMSKKIPSKKIVDDRKLLLARFQVQDLFSPCRGHGSWMRRTLKCTLKCSEPMCDFHSTGNDLTSETHTPSQRHMPSVHDCTIPFTCRNHQRSHFLLDLFDGFSTVPAGAESYFGGACAIARTPKRSFSSPITALLNVNMAGPLSDLTMNSG